MKLDKLLQSRKTLAAHAQESVSAPLAYKMMKFLKASDNEDAFYIAKLHEIIEKYKDTESEQKPQDGEIHIRKDKLKECNEEVVALTSTDVEAPPIKFTLQELSELKLSVAEMYTLDEFIIEEG